MNDRARPFIVVGVDGSDSSIRALRWALEEARQRDASVRAVLSWEMPAVVGDVMGGMTFDPSLLAEGAQAQLDEALAAACPDEAERARVERHVVLGSPASALIGQAEGAALLVVGSRGHGGFLGLLLGSVAQHCVTHATCPVVVVPHERH